MQNKGRSQKKGSVWPFGIFPTQSRLFSDSVPKPLLYPDHHVREPRRGHKQFLSLQHKIWIADWYQRKSHI